MDTSTDNLNTNEDMLKSQIAALENELDNKNQTIYQYRKDIELAHVLETEYFQVIEALQRSEQDKVAQLQKEIKQLEENILKLRDDLNPELIEKAELIENLQIQIRQLAITSSKNVECSNKESERIKAEAERNAKLKQDVSVLNNHLHEVETHVDKLQAESVMLQESGENLRDELNKAKEYLGHKTQELTLAKNDIQKLQEDLFLTKLEMESLKSCPLDPSKKGNSLFAEVDDSRVKMQQNIQLTKKNSNDLQRLVSNKLKHLHSMRARNLSLSKELDLFADYDSEYEKKLDEYKSKVAVLESALDEYKKNIAKREKFIGKNLPDYVVEFANNTINAIWDDGEKGREALDRASKEKLDTFVQIQNVSVEMRKSRRRALQLKVQIEELESSIVESQLLDGPTDHETDADNLTTLTERNNTQKDAILNSQIQKSDYVEIRKKNIAEDVKLSAPLVSERKIKIETTEFIPPSEGDESAREAPTNKVDNASFIKTVATSVVAIKKESPDEIPAANCNYEDNPAEKLVKQEKLSTTFSGSVEVANDIVPHAGLDNKENLASRNNTGKKLLSSYRNIADESELSFAIISDVSSELETDASKPAKENAFLKCNANSLEKPVKENLSVVSAESFEVASDTVPHSELDNKKNFTSPNTVCNKIPTLDHKYEGNFVEKPARKEKSSVTFSDSLKVIARHSELGNTDTSPNKVDKTPTKAFKAESHMENLSTPNVHNIRTPQNKAQVSSNLKYAGHTPAANKEHQMSNVTVRIIPIKTLVNELAESSQTENIFSSNGSFEDRQTNLYNKENSTSPNDSGKTCANDFEEQSHVENLSTPNVRNIITPQNKTSNLKYAGHTPAANKHQKSNVTLRIIPAKTLADELAELGKTENLSPSAVSPKIANDIEPRSGISLPNKTDETSVKEFKEQSRVENVSIPNVHDVRTPQNKMHASSNLKYAGHTPAAKRQNQKSNVTTETEEVTPAKTLADEFAESNKPENLISSNDLTKSIDKENLHPPQIKNTGCTLLSSKKFGSAKTLVGLTPASNQKRVAIKSTKATPASSQKYGMTSGSRSTPAASQKCCATAKMSGVTPLTNKMYDPAKRTGITPVTKMTAGQKCSQTKLSGVTPVTNKTCDMAKLTPATKITGTAPVVGQKCSAIKSMRVMPTIKVVEATPTANHKSLGVTVSTETKEITSITTQKQLPAATKNSGMTPAVQRRYNTTKTSETKVIKENVLQNEGHALKGKSTNIPVPVKRKLI